MDKPIIQLFKSAHKPIKLDGLKEPTPETISRLEYMKKIPVSGKCS